MISAIKHFLKKRNKYSIRIPLSFFIDSEKVISHRNLKGIDADAFRTGEIQRFIRIHANLKENTYRNLLETYMNIDSPSDDELINNFLDIHALARIVGTKNINDEHRNVILKYAEALAWRNLGRQVAYLYRS